MHENTTDGTCVVLAANECFENNAAVATGGEKGRKSDGTCLVITALQCVDTSVNAPAAFGETVILAASTKQCVAVALTTECYDTAREAKGTVVALVQTRAVDGTCTLAAVDSAKCFDIATQALADTSSTVGRDANSLCFSLASNECFENDAASPTSATKAKHSTTSACVDRADDQCFESDAAVNTSATKALKSDGTCVVLTATECS